MADFSRLIDGLVAQYDMRSELDKRKAFQTCADFAQEHVEAGEYTEFLRQAAEKLGQMRQFDNLTNPLVKSDGRERIHLRFDEGEGAQLIGNPSGLLYLSRVLRGLSQTEHAGEYVYFYCGEGPMDEYSIPLAIYREDDAFFEELDTGDADLLQDDYYEADSVERNIAPEDIVAFFTAGDAPEEYHITPMRVYPVLGVEQPSPDTVWPMLPKNVEPSNVVVVIFTRDDGELMRLALRLDDPMMGFLTQEDLGRLLGK